MTSFSRPSIYNYFQTKEEIFLAILKKEYELWIADLETVMKENETLKSNVFAEKVAESLVEFKVAYGRSLQTFATLLGKFFPEMTVEERQNFIYRFFPFIYGIYPYTFVTDKQKEAMRQLTLTRFQKGCCQLLA